jgi:hypothetical protein
LLLFSIQTYTIGHPLGLSKKYDDGGRIWAIDGGTTGRGIKIFSTSDTFSGSPGSPIFDADGRIIAMHTSGNGDFFRTRNQNCDQFVNCTTGITMDDDDCHEGELGTSICYLSPWSMLYSRSLALALSLSLSLSFYLLA